VVFALKYLFSLFYYEGFYGFRKLIKK